MNSEMTEIENLPEARTGRAWYPFPLIWIVPLIAALFAGYVLYEKYQGLGPKISVSFNDANGLKAGQSPIQYRGVMVGLVTDLELSADMRHAVAIIRLRRSAEDIAREGSVFWVVSPQVQETSISGLGTVFTGPYINVEPGTGDAKTEFSGLGQEPPSASERGMTVTLRAADLGSVSKHSLVYYRGVPVGGVREVNISTDSSMAEVKLTIKTPYIKLITSGTRFWKVNLANLQGGLLDGFHLKIDSLRSLMVGGIAFATPPGSAKVKDGAVFHLEDAPEDDWLEWEPKIALSAEQLKLVHQEDELEASKAIGPMLIKKEK